MYKRQAETVTVNKPSSDSNADPNGSEYSSTAVIGGGQRDFDISGSSSSRTFHAGINLSSDSIVTVTPITNAYITSGPIAYNIQLVVTIDHANDEFTVTCYWNNGAVAPSADFTFTFIAIK